MATLTQYRQAAIQRVNDPNGFARIVAVTAVSGQTVTCASLATGGISSTTMQGRWILWADCSVPADRLRFCTKFDSITGKFFHEGAAYTSTATGTLEIWEYNPLMIEQGINTILQRLRFRDLEIIPTNGNGYYWLGQLDWIERPGQVAAVYYAVNPVISRNRFMQKWPQPNANVASATNTPQWWDLSGTDGTCVRTTSNVYRPGQSGALITRNGHDVTFSQTTGLLDDGVIGQDLRGRSVGIYARVKASDDAQVYAYLDDGQSIQQTIYGTKDLQSDLNPGNATFAISTSATKLEFGIKVVKDGTVVVSDLCASYLYMNDAVKRNLFPSGPQAPEIPKTWDQSGDLMLTASAGYGLGGQIQVASSRGFLPLSADTDTSDAPLAPVAVGAIWKLFEGLSVQPGRDITRFSQLATVWENKFRPLAAKQHQTEFGGYGVQMPARLLMPLPRRVG